jgi:hypothetical protein
MPRFADRSPDMTYRSNTAYCFIMTPKLSHDSSTEDLNVHDIKQG